MDKQTLAHLIYQVSYREGDFLLRSGQRSKEYFDKYQFESRPEILREITRHLLPLIPQGTEVLAGLELGGVPLATALSLESGLPVVFVRKEAKTYGTMLLAEGLSSLSGRQVCIIEDVITTGGQVVLSAQQLRQQGAHLLGVLCVILRGSTQALEQENLKLQSLFSMDEIKKSKIR
jgi:orotate phosphoribosyltransferase